jgi:hypothetical protein
MGTGGKIAGVVNLTTHSHLALSSRKMELYLHSHICLHGVVLNYIIKYKDKFTYSYNTQNLEVTHVEELQRT